MGAETEPRAGSGATEAPSAEPLSPADATLLCATTADVQLQIGGLCRFEGGPLRDAEGRLRIDDLREHVESRLPLVPRFRQRIQRVPFDLSRPVWVDDADFDLDRHFRTASLPEPGGDVAMREFMADLLAQPLDPDHPLWDMWLVDGLGDGDVAVVLRVHHVLADGLSLLREAMALLDLEADAPPTPPAEPWQAAAAPGPLAMLADGLMTRGRHQMELGITAARRLIDPRTGLAATRVALNAIASPPKTVPPLGVTGRVGNKRDFLWASRPFEPFRALARSCGATVNDVVLAAVTGALRRQLAASEASALEGRTPRVLVPVGDTSGDDGGNLFSFVVADLPVHLENPRHVLEHIHGEMSERKASQQSAGMLSLFSVIDVLPVGLLRQVAPEVLARQPFVNLAVSNIPGSPIPLYLLGARLLELEPIITGVGNIACIVGVLSYCDQLGVSVTVDPDVVDDADAFLDALLDAIDELTAELS